MIMANTSPSKHTAAQLDLTWIYDFITALNIAP